MDVHGTLSARNAAFAETGFMPGLRMLPILKTIVIGCVDPRVDPAALFGAEPGELVILRNVGGRVTPDVLSQLAVLRGVSQAAGGNIGAGWEILVLHHTDCGITKVAGRSDLLAPFFGVEPADLAGRVVDDPRAAVVVDVDAVRAETRLGAGIRVSGLVYDVLTGRVETVAAPA